MYIHLLFTHHTVELRSSGVRTELDNMTLARRRHHIALVYFFFLLQSADHSSQSVCCYSMSLWADSVLSAVRHVRLRWLLAYLPAHLSLTCIAYAVQYSAIIA